MVIFLIINNLKQYFSKHQKVSADRKMMSLCARILFAFCLHAYVLRSFRSANVRFPSNNGDVPPLNVEFVKFIDGCEKLDKNLGGFLEELDKNLAFFLRRVLYFFLCCYIVNVVTFAAVATASL